MCAGKAFNTAESRRKGNIPPAEAATIRSNEDTLSAGSGELHCEIRNGYFCIDDTG